MHSIAIFIRGLRAYGDVGVVASLCLGIWGVLLADVAERAADIIAASEHVVI